MVEGLLRAGFGAQVWWGSLRAQARIDAAIAQLVEHIIRNDGVGGSIPSCGTNKIKQLTTHSKSARHRSGTEVGWLAMTRYAILASGSLGKSKSSATRRDLHRGHFSHSASIEIGNSAPRVHTSESRSRRTLILHSRMRPIASRWPQAHLAVIFNPRSRAWSRVSIILREHKTRTCSQRKWID